MSCDTCPQRIPSTEIGERILKTIDYGEGVDYCAARGIPLGRPDMDITQMLEAKVKFAEKCGSKDDPPPPTKLKSSIGKVGRAVDVSIERRTKAEIAPRDCRECAFAMHPSEVRRRYGWGLFMCMAKGELIPTNKLRGTATGCDLGVDKARLGTDAPDTPIVTHENVKLLAVYGSASEVTPSDAARARLSALPDPRDYRSDRAVSFEDANQGIMAWRELRHPIEPDGDFDSVWLPIFDREWEGWTKQEREKIPVRGGDEMVEYYVDHHNLLYYVGGDFTNGMSPVLVGAAGTGKTEFFRYMAYQCQLPFDRISITNSTEVADIIGKHLVKVAEGSTDSVTEWINGRIPTFLPRPGVAVIDEPNLGPKDVMEVIRPIIDSSSQLVLDQDEGQRILRHAYRYLGFAMNPSWDYRYQGANDMNEADLNRMTSFAVDFPSPETERDVIINHCNAHGYHISNKKLDQLMQLTKDLRPATDPDNGTLSFSWGMRVMLTVAMSTRYKTLEESVRTFADRLDPTERSQVMSYVKTIA